MSRRRASLGRKSVRVMVEPLESRRLLSAALVVGPDLQSVLELLNEHAGAQGQDGTNFGGELAQPIDDGLATETDTPIEQAEDPTVVVGPVLPEEVEEPASPVTTVDP